MQKAKKYMINRTKYKEIKKFDHAQMESFMQDIYKSGYMDGRDSAPGVELEDVLKVLTEVKGIGPKVMQGIREAVDPLFQKKELNE